MADDADAALQDDQYQIEDQPQADGAKPPREPFRPAQRNNRRGPGFAGHAPTILEDVELTDSHGNMQEASRMSGTKGEFFCGAPKMERFVDAVQRGRASIS